MKKNLRIGLLECDHVEGRFSHLKGGYREMFTALLAPHLPGLTFSYYDACHGVLPARPSECDAYICSGSQYSVYDEREWIAPLQKFVRQVREAGTPFVGICFGHQMLAQALGGEVTRAAQGWGVGVREMDIVRQEPWMSPRLAECRLQYMHADQVQKLPEGSTVLGRSDHCEVAMFKVGESMLGIEGHPEFPAAFNEALIRGRREKIGAARADEALRGVNGPTDAPLVGKWIAEFLSTPASRTPR
jgi:GMP synthase-like glutamine amidotransferase